MIYILLLFITPFIYATGLSQPSDFIVVKKNSTRVKSFFKGSNINFETDRGFFSGQINAVKKDSLFLTQFDVRQVPTSLGIFVLDTVATYRLQFNYKEIIAITNEKPKGFDRSVSGGSLLGGGVLITAVGLGTWIFTKPGTRYYASPRLVIGSAVLAGIGYLLLKSNNAEYKIGKKYRLEYVKVN